MDTVVISTQHAPNASQKKIKEDVIEQVIRNVIPDHLLDNKTKYYVNPTGRFEIGGPHGDSGLTGRKIIVQTMVTPAMTRNVAAIFPKRIVDCLV